PSVCEHCSSGCAERTDFRRGKVQRILAGDDPEVNEEWICDKGRFAFRYTTADGRLTRPLVRNAKTGELEPASWTEALRAAAEGVPAGAKGKPQGYEGLPHRPVHHRERAQDLGDAARLRARR